MRRADVEAKLLTMVSVTYIIRKGIYCRCFTVSFSSLPVRRIASDILTKADALAH